MYKSLMAMVGGFLLAGCATIISGNDDEIYVRSEDPAAGIYVDGTRRGFGTVTTTVSRGPHVIEARKAGCHPVSVKTRRAFDPISLVGIFIDGGIISIPLDFILGGARKVHPQHYTVTPYCEF